MGERAQSFQALSGLSYFSWAHCQGAHSSPVFWPFYGGRLTLARLIKLQSTGGRFNSQSHSPSWMWARLGAGGVKGTESSNPLITGWFPILSCFPKVTSLTSSGVVQSSLLWIFTTFIILLILEIPRVLSSVPETRWGSDMYLLLYVMISYIFLFPRYFVAPSFCWNRSSSISPRNGLH